MSRADEVENDPILEPFLSFLAKDLHENPHRVSTLSNDFVGQVQSLIADQAATYTSGDCRKQTSA